MVSIGRRRFRFGSVVDWCGRGLWNVRGYVENAGRVCVERYIDREVVLGFLSSRVFRVMIW